MSQNVKTFINTSPYIQELKDSYYYKATSKILAVKDLQKICSDNDIQTIKKRSSVITQFVVTCIVAMLVVIGVSLAIVVPSCLTFSTTATWISSVAVISFFLALSFGASMVLLHVHRKKDHFLGEPNNLFQQRVLVCACLERTKYSYFETLIDLSTLDKEGNGIALTHYYFSHWKKSDFQKDSFQAIFCLPFITLGAMTYNISRAMWMPLYILSRIIKGAIQKSDAPYKFTLKDILKETLLSIKRALVAPFYSTAMFFSLVYSLIAIKTGRIITGMIERAWNEDIPISKGFQLVQYNEYRKHADWKWEGGLLPTQLGQNACYLAGCMQPTGIFLVENWNIVLGLNRSSAYTKIDNNLNKKTPSLAPIYLYTDNLPEGDPEADNISITSHASSNSYF